MTSANLIIEEIQQIAKKRSWECLSNNCADAHTRLSWKCNEGHVWKATLRAIKYRTKRCPICAERELGRRGIIILNKRNSRTKKTKLLQQKVRKQPYESDAAREIVADVKKRISPRKLTIEIMDELAKERGGKCLSTKYVNIGTKLRWQCEKGHIWKARPYSIKCLNTWCPSCAKKRLGKQHRLTIEEMQKIAREMGGKCLSTEYTHINKKLQWQCNNGHIWQVSPARIKYAKVWCPFCSIKNLSETNANTAITNQQSLQSGKWGRYTLDMVQKIAKERGGECLSSEYNNIHSKLWWRCAEGHIWQSALKSVKHRSAWCPVCAASNRGQKRISSKNKPNAD